jgi:hypothetical protein
VSRVAGSFIFGPRASAHYCNYLTLSIFVVFALGGFMALSRTVFYRPPFHIVSIAILLVVCAASLHVAGSAAAQATQEKNSTRQTSVTLSEPGSFTGYTLVFPLQSKNTYLVDMQGRVVRSWQSKYMAGQDAYLLPNGNLLRAAKLNDSEAFFAGEGAGGRVQEFTWEGDLVWDYKFHNMTQIQHHAITRMPNGNVMLIVWERKTLKQAAEAGVNPDLAGGEFLVDSLIEIKPKGKTGGEIVWEWHLWDHLVQDFDKTKANFGNVAEHPELVDVNFARDERGKFGKGGFGGPKGKKEPKKTPANDENLAKLKGIGYIGASGGNKFAGFFPDWTHVNAVAYNPQLDQIMICPRRFHEFWIIDHSTTKAEAAGHMGGKSGKGGDLLYRWGNPRAYRAGTQADQQLFAQHDAHWIPDGLPGAGHVLIFNNGGGRPGGNFSSVDEIVLPVDSEGKYAHKTGTRFGPEKPVWSYAAPKKSEFFAAMMSGAQRLPNGNTLVSTGFGGTIFEVKASSETVWKFITPNDSSLGMSGPGGGKGFGGFGGFGGTAIFRAYRYGPDYSGLAGKDLTPGATIDQLRSK